MPIVLTPSAAAGAVGIADYGDLKLQIADWLNRTDLSEEIPEFVRIAESKIRTDIKVRTQELTLATVVATVDTISLPSQLNEIRRLTVEDRELTYVSPDQYIKQERKMSGRPAMYYTIIGQSIKAMNVAVGDDYVLTYWEWFDYFTLDDDTNWLLLNSPDVYLWASLEAGALFLKDYEASIDFGNRYREAVARVQRRENEMRYSGSPLVMRAELREC